MSDLSKHTPGPWVSMLEIDLICDSEKHDGSAFPTAAITTEDDCLYTDCYEKNVCYVDLDNSRAEANLRLIAAAPEMLEALENIENDDGKLNLGAWGLIKSAIAKATGEEAGDE